MVTFDPNKNRRNIADHGVALSEAERFDWEHAIIEEDDSEAYGEQREKATGFIGLDATSTSTSMRGEAEERASASERQTNRKTRLCQNFENR